MARRRVLALAGLTALGCLLSTGSTAAQTGPTPIDPAKALQAALSTGKVTGAHGEAATGWVLARGVVVTSSIAAPLVGSDAQFSSIGATAPALCRAAATDSATGVAILQCSGLSAPPLRRTTSDLINGATIVAVSLGLDGAPVLTTGTASRLGESRKRIDRLVLTLDQDVHAPGAPVLDDGGLVTAVIVNASVSRHGTASAVKLRGIASVILDSEGLGESRLDAILRLARKYLAIPLAVAVVLGAFTGWRSALGSAWKRALGLGIFVVIVGTSFGAVAYLFAGDGMLLP
ncbi:MAG TPA: hypothetical protein PKD80_16945 [Microthrixaceae bacterium]|mgnify:CR=1 FL=1|jgi:hypothetical protein|nr:hypothetical protein [Microthrixaceae bacterium]HMT23123.1 hypothetical protein [Microthrixaceae bacterium]